MQKKAPKRNKVAESLSVLFLLASVFAGTAQADETRWSPQAAAKYLEARADWWLTWSGSARGQGTVCLSCHTAVPFALARPALGTSSPAEKSLLDSVSKRVQNWDRVVSASGSNDKSLLTYYSGNRRASALGTEAVLNALVLVSNDTGKAKRELSSATKLALDHLWQQQQKNGAWLWLDFGLNPWEHEAAYYGASLAALAVGMASSEYYHQQSVQTKVALLKDYLRSSHAAQPLHHRTVALWASAKLPDILAEADKKKVMEDLLAIQTSDGGWSLPHLGQTQAAKSEWKAHGVYPDGAQGDGYATGLAVLALKSAGLATDPRVGKGVRWLIAHENNGTWPIHYPNKNRDPQENIGNFMRDASTAFAVLALTSSQ